MKQKICLSLLLFICFTCFTHAQVQQTYLANVNLPAQYFRLLEAGISRIEKQLTNEPGVNLATLEAQPGWKHFPSSILIPAVLYTKSHPSNTLYGNPQLLKLAQQIGDLLVSEHKKGLYTPRLDSDWDSYMWLESYRLLESYLNEKQRSQWRMALLENIELLEPMLLKCKDYPMYNAPFITTSPNHYAIYASTLLVAGYVFNRPEWKQMATDVLHRFAVEEQAADGYFGEHSKVGPTTGYDYLTVTQMALYWEYSKDPDALHALRRSTDFHKYFTYPDGTPVETINDRNRYWDVSMWGHFGFSNFPDGRRYAAFLTGFFPPEGDIQSLSRIAQNLLYYHEGDMESIPQDQSSYVHVMQIPAGIRKTGPWVVCLSGLIAHKDIINNFFLDRQGNFSIFHSDRGLIITGANSKRQPELATFTEKIEGQIVHMPLSSKLKMEDNFDRLALSYNTFFAVMEVPTPSEKQIAFRFLTTYKWGDAKSQLNIQLVFKAGQSLKTGSGLEMRLGSEPIELTEKDLGGSIQHNGWLIQLPPGARLTWPVFPFNPYRDGQETELQKAIGVLSVPLIASDQELQFIIKVNGD
jgi:hypothetical protein